MNQDPILAIALPVTLFVMMLGMGANLSPGDFRLLLSRPAAVLCGIASQMLLLPLLGFLLLSALALPAEITVGFMILALSPGGTTSNIFAYLAGGNLALSIALTAVVSLVTPLSLPLLATWLLSSRLAAGAELTLPFLPTIGKLVAITLVPVFLATSIGRPSTPWTGCPARSFSFKEPKTGSSRPTRPRPWSRP